MSERSERVIEVLRELELALEEFRTAYTTWLAGGGDGHDDAARALKHALERAEERLDAARALLAGAGSE